ncbi:MAG: cytochrome P450 [Novosphingobium sp.]
MTSRSAEPPLPQFRFRDGQVSLWTMLRHGVGDVGSVIPAAILEQDAVQLTGRGAPLVVSTPELAREVLIDRADQFDRDRFIRRLFRRSWGKGLAAAEGEDWQRQRRAAVPFFTPKAVRTRLAAFAAAADAVLDEVEDGETVDLGKLAARIVARVVFGVLVDASGAVDIDAAAADVSPYIRRIGGFSLVDLLPLPERLIDHLHGIDGDPAVRRLRALGSTLAAARGHGDAQDDLIALLEGVGPVEDNIRGLFPAAMDTTVNGLGWALSTLGLRPDWQARVAAEGQAQAGASALEQLPATRTVVSEVLRLYPPAPLLARSAARDMELAGLPVRAGQTVLVCAYAMHRHRRYWDSPDRFDPDRWTQGPANPDAYMPFGTGPRMCPAAHFAQAEMAVILAQIVARFRVEPNGPDPEVSLQTTTRALGGLSARLHLRG